MATTFLAQYQAATGDQTFIERVEMGMLQTANNLAGEVSSTPNHANRMALMKACSNNPAQYAPLFALSIASESIDGTSTDAQIQTQISASWNTIAGQV